MAKLYIYTLGYSCNTYITYPIYYKLMYFRLLMFYQHGHSTKIRHAFKECFSQTVDVYRMELFLFILLLSRCSAHVAFIIGVSIFSWVLHSVHHLRFYLLRQLTYQYHLQVGKKFPQKRSNNENEYIEQNIEKFKDFFFIKIVKLRKQLGVGTGS